MTVPEHLQQTRNAYSVGKVLEAFVIDKIDIIPEEDRNYAGFPLFAVAEGKPIDKDPTGRRCVLFEDESEFMARPPVIGDVMVCRTAICRDVMSREEYEIVSAWWQRHPDGAE